jgi:hypothetical protein
MRANGNLLIAEPWLGRALEYDTTLPTPPDPVVTEYPVNGWQNYEGGEFLMVRDARPLPNGNVLVIDSIGSLIEFNPAGTVVWRCKVADYVVHNTDANMDGRIDVPRADLTMFKATRFGNGFNRGW